MSERDIMPEVRAHYTKIVLTFIAAMLVVVAIELYIQTKKIEHAVNSIDFDHCGETPSRPCHVTVER